MCGMPESLSRFMFVLASAVLLFLLTSLALAYSEDYNYTPPIFISHTDHNNYNYMPKFDIIYSAINFSYNNFIYNAAMRASEAANKLKNWAQYSVPSYMIDTPSTFYASYPILGISSQNTQKLSTPVIKNIDILSKEDTKALLGSVLPPVFITDNQNQNQYNWIAPPKIIDTNK